jgi:hypothetical protein
MNAKNVLYHHQIVQDVIKMDHFYINKSSMKNQIFINAF